MASLGMSGFVSGHGLPSTTISFTCLLEKIKSQNELIVVCFGACVAMIENFLPSMVSLIILLALITLSSFVTYSPFPDVISLLEFCFPTEPMFGYLSLVESCSLILPSTGISLNSCSSGFVIDRRALFVLLLNIALTFELVILPAIVSPSIKVAMSLFFTVFFDFFIRLNPP